MKPNELVLYAQYDVTECPMPDVAKVKVLTYQGMQGGNYSFSSGGAGLFILTADTVSFFKLYVVEVPPPKQQGLRYNSSKLQWNLVDMELLEPLVKVLEFGAKKYAANNWRKGLPVTEILDSMQRHINALAAREDVDPESGIPHEGHIMANVMFLTYMLKYKKEEFDNRYIDANKQQLCQ